MKFRSHCRVVGWSNSMPFYRNFIANYEKVRHQEILKIISRTKEISLFSSNEGRHEHARALGIKGILFDVDGTLYHQKPLRLIMAVLLTFSHIYRPRELFRKLKVIYHYRKSQEILRDDYPTDQNNRETQMNITAERCCEPLTYIHDVISEWFETKPLPFMKFCRRKGMKKTISMLHKKGLKLGVFSDYPPHDKLSALGVHRFFSIILSSHDIGIFGFKPNTNGFAIAAEKMNLSPSEILYIGDRHEVDGIGASQAGMRVAIVNDEGFESMFKTTILKPF